MQRMRRVGTGRRAQRKREQRDKLASRTGFGERMRRDRSTWNNLKFSLLQNLQGGPISVRSDALTHVDHALITAGKSWDPVDNRWWVSAFGQVRRMSLQDPNPELKARAKRMVQKHKATFLKLMGKQ